MIDIDRFIENHRATRHKYEDDDGIESVEGVHCPHCERFHNDPTDLAESGVYAEGVREFTCGDCNTDFMVETRIEHTWKSTKIDADE